MSNTKKVQEQNYSHQEYIKTLGVDPQDFIKDYVNARALVAGPQAREELEKLVADARDDIKNLAKIIRHFEAF